MTAAGDSARSEVASPAELGPRLREARRGRGISLRELARRVHVSPSLVSQIETGKIHPSVSTLYALATELGASVDHLLFEGTPTGAPAPRVGTDPVRDHPNLPPVIRSDDRKVIRLSSGVRWEQLTAGTVPGLDFLHVIYPSGSESAPEDAMQRHPGREWGYVTSGTLHVTIAFNNHVLEAGDAISFDSTVPHRLYNIGGKDAHAVWFVLGRHSGHP